MVEDRADQYGGQELSSVVSHGGTSGIQCCSVCLCRMACQFTAGMVRVASRTSTTATRSQQRYDLSMFSELSRSMPGSPLSKLQCP